MIVWLGFFLLVAFGIHGSSTPLSAQLWASEKPYYPYLFGVPNVLIRSLDPEQLDQVRALAMARGQWIRGDEFMVATPFALSQLSHKPAFPVVNTNIGGGQNMLVWGWSEFPVLHPTVLARPATWGYFFLGPQRGLAWYWWFQVFSCFTALYLFLVIVLKGHQKLAAFGAFWFCGSAYVVGWSLWPAHVVFHAALACVSLYYLLASKRLSTQVICAILSGLAITGFSMMLYPPWQVSVGYLFLLMFVGLFIRDKLYLSIRSASRHQLVCFGAAFLLAAGLIGSFLLTCLPALRLMSGTTYPGNRVSLGGDYSFALLFKGMYNLFTINQPPPGFLRNESEAASFYHLFPAVFPAVFLSKQLLARMGVFGWLLLCNLLVMLYFMLVGFPATLARLTLLSYSQPARMDLAVGLASIILCIYVLALASDRVPVDGWWTKVAPSIAGSIVTVFFILHGVSTIKASGADGPTVEVILLASGMAGLAAFCLLAGRKKVFCGVAGVVIVATSALFNPLSTSLSHLYNSELAQQVVRLNKQAGGAPLWLCYGNVQPDNLISALGGRALAGTQWPPQLALWSKFDPEGKSRGTYNRFAQVGLIYDGEASPVSFTNPQGDLLFVHISPNNPVLKEMGARYVLAFDEHQQTLVPATLDLIYKSPTGKFSIFEIR